MRSNDASSAIGGTECELKRLTIDDVKAKRSSDEKARPSVGSPSRRNGRYLVLSAGRLTLLVSALFVSLFMA